MDNQDWTPVVVKRRSTPGSQQIATQKTADTQSAIHAARIDGDDLKPKKRRLTVESRQALVAARCIEKKSQRDVEKDLSLPPNIMRDWEAGTLAPTGPQISALQRRFAAAHLVLRVEVV